MITRKLMAIAIVGAFAAACSSGSGGGGGGANPGSYQHCTTDSECPTGQACDTEHGSSSDGYCTPLCSTDNECPMGYDCPGLVKDQPGECDEICDHAGGHGLCDQFNGVAGPNTC